jgi:nucleoid-associated protein YgaU
MRVDTDYAYKDYPTIIKNAGLNGYTKDTVTTTQTSTKKSNEEIANEVIAGKWDNGEARKTALTNAGYDYDAIQKIVNQKMGVTNTSTRTYYTVQKGDTLWAIAKKYYGDGNKYTEIAKANNISNPNVISVGQKLLIP